LCDTIFVYTHYMVTITSHTETSHTTTCRTIPDGIRHLTSCLTNTVGYPEELARKLAKRAIAKSIDNHTVVTVAYVNSTTISVEAIYTGILS